MRRRYALGLLAGAATAGLAGCGGGGAAPPPGPSPGTDAGYVDALRLGRTAFTEGRYRQAAILYDRALERAKRRDDLEGIARAAFERGLTALRIGEPQAAVALAERTDAELRRRGAEPRPELAVLAAWGVYMAGDLAGAEQRVAALGPVDGALGERVAMLGGLIAVDRRDAAGLARAIARIEPSATGDPAAEADLLELRGHADGLSGNPDAARAGFLEAVRRRRLDGDIHGVARGLAAAADAAVAAGRPGVAADLYLRAARAGQSHGAMAEASRLWLVTARDLARANGLPAVASEAEDMLRDA